MLVGWAVACWIALHLQTEQTTDFTQVSLQSDRSAWFHPYVNSFCHKWGEKKSLSVFSFPASLPPSSASSAVWAQRPGCDSLSQPLWGSHEEKGAVALLTRLGCTNTRLSYSGIIFVCFSGKQTIHSGLGVFINRMQAGRKFFMHNYVDLMMQPPGRNFFFLL